ncbi:MAG: hypothetical protein M0R77_15055 [Gammaproteobacteria bacterium]|nr:hypothetical protein [Gammaproteobacteria bacterium]
MKKVILAAALMLGVTSPVMATVTNPALPPETVNLMIVSVGTLYNDNMVKMTNGDGKSITVHLSDCDIDWNTGDSFYLVVSQSGAAYTVPVVDFQVAYRMTGKNWNDTVNLLARAGKMCKVRAD